MKKNKRITKLQTDEKLSMKRLQQILSGNLFIYLNTLS